MNCLLQVNYYQEIYLLKNMFKIPIFKSEIGYKNATYYHFTIFINYISDCLAWQSENNPHVVTEIETKSESINKLVKNLVIYVPRVSVFVILIKFQFKVFHNDFGNACIFLFYNIKTKAHFYFSNKMDSTNNTFLYNSKSMHMIKM